MGSRSGSGPLVLRLFPFRCPPRPLLLRPFPCPFRCLCHRLAQLRPGPWSLCLLRLCRVLSRLRGRSLPCPRPSIKHGKVLGLQCYLHLLPLFLLPPSPQPLPRRPVSLGRGSRPSRSDRLLRSPRPVFAARSRKGVVPSRPAGLVRACNVEIGSSANLSPVLVRPGLVSFISAYQIFGRLSFACSSPSALQGVAYSRRRGHCTSQAFRSHSRDSFAGHLSPAGRRQLPTSS
jgi:hypothetical protein